MNLRLLVLVSALFVAACASDYCPMDNENTWGPLIPSGESEASSDL